MLLLVSGDTPVMTERIDYIIDDVKKMMKTKNQQDLKILASFTAKWTWVDKIQKNHEYLYNNIITTKCYMIIIL